MNKALICVDVQTDFLPGGALGVTDGDLVVPELIRAMNDVDVIVLTRDWHPADHISFSDNPQFVDKSWPPHCVESTPGVMFDQSMVDAAKETGKPILIVHKGFVQNEEAYSGFAGLVVGIVNRRQSGDLGESALAWALSALSVSEVRVGGLALDYCVKATALDSAAYGFKTSVYLTATRPVGYLTGAQAILELIQNDIELKGY